MLAGEGSAGIIRQMEVALFLGQTALDRGEHAQAFEMFVLAARTRHPKAVNMLGRAYERGWGVSRNVRQAMACFHYAARKREGWAHFNLGDLYFSGEGIAVSQQKAFSHYLAAARLGVNKALNMLGILYEQGVPTGISDVKIAMTYYKAGAEAGDCWGFYNMGRLALGEGKKDASASWFREAVRYEFPGCYFALRELLEGVADKNLQALRVEITAKIQGQCV
ncbi:tetratricopeptide repeat protein [Acetobacteraceae bacterium ESL0709]|nr:tetratricopeptide repeat protein [Acetobacteraceae bacterium ESL0697]MDF7677968.1 tetratricopeptide repeat protein [Acetobacteraceae bacterium ESL0709]